jgi:hypothetical protein
MSTSWVKESIPSFSIRLRRCALTVRSVVPSSYAICLFNPPRETRSKTWRSRGVRPLRSRRKPSSFSFASCLARPRAIPRSIAASSLSFARGSSEGLPPRP